MAEFALGLTKTAVEGTLSLVKSAVEEEGQLREKVQSDLVFITGEFEVMQAFLKVANRERTANDEVALALVRQLRTLAFDVEDCVEYVLHLDNKSCWAWLRRAWAKVYICASPLPLDMAIAELKQLKARVEDVSLRNTRYNNILHGSDKNKLPVTVVPLALPPEQPPYSTTTLLRDAWKATGKWRNDVCNLKKELLIVPEGEDARNLQVISVWGTTTSAGEGAVAANLGTASIFSNVFCDPEVCEEFKCRAWVKLTHPSNHDDFVKSLLSQFCATSHQANAEFMQGNFMRAKKAIKQQMSRQKYLLVLEDVLTVAEWDVIRTYLPGGNNGSRILLSTPHLGIALHCTGQPYQVSDLSQFLCVFSRKVKAPSDDIIGKFYSQLQQGHGVISVWGDGNSNLVDTLYTGVINGWLEEIRGAAAKSDPVDMLLEGIRNSRSGIELRHSSWVDVPYPFNSKVFARRLFLSFHSDDIRATEITEVGKKGEVGLVEWCCKFLSEGMEQPYVVVINDVRSTDVWDQIQSTFFSSMTRTAKGCIFVVTNEETVAAYCVKDYTPHIALNAEDLKADPSISTLIKKGFWHYGIKSRHRKGRLFYDRNKYEEEWANKFKDDVGPINPYSDIGEGEDKVEEGFRVSIVLPDFWEDLYSENGVLRHAYYGALFQQQIERRSWVDVSPDVDLRDFSWRLLLDFYSDNPKAKEDIAVGLMEGTISDPPIQECREFLDKKKCLVVIHGEMSTELRDSMMATFFCGRPGIQSIVLVQLNMWNMFCRMVPGELDGREQGRLIYMEYRRALYSTKKIYQDAIQWVDTCQLIGRDRGEAFKLEEHLMNHRTGLLSVWGIPGVGKSTLVRTVYYDEILRSSRLDESITYVSHHEAFAWVDVPSPFNLTEFAWRLLLGFYSHDPEAKEAVAVSMTAESRHVPILECRKILRTGNCLVIMDGLRSKQDWDLIQATFLAEHINKYKGTTIVVITNEGEVAMHCVENDKERAINITRLDASDSLSLYKKELTATHKLFYSLDIVAKCGGLPKLIAAIGSCGYSISSSLSRDFMGTLETDPYFHGLRPLFSWMQSYFDACSDSIKPCIFYLSIFSTEKNIRWRRLLWRWVAEGYCRDTSDGRTWEENWENFVSELIKLSIIQRSASSEVFCEINGFFCEYIISRPMEDNLVFILDGSCNLNSQRAGQHLTIRSSWDRRDRIVYESIDFSRLRSLTVFGKWESFFCSKKVNLRLLRVLDLEDATDVTNEDLEQIAKLLTRLKFLSLRGCKEITCLPTSMGCMRQLQILDIRLTSIVTLPIFITELEKLRYIRAGGTPTEKEWDWEGDVIAADDGEGGDGKEDDGEEDSASYLAAVGGGATGSSVSVASNNKPCTSVSSFLSKLCKRGGGLDNNNGPAATGVTVPADIGNLVLLHTLGVVKVSAQCGNKAIFKALEQLTQLRKLGVSGINKGNIQEFCKAISGHAHLKSLSVELDKDDDLDDNIPSLPMTIKRLKLHGVRAHKLVLVWMKHLENLEKLHLTIEKPGDFGNLTEFNLYQFQLYEPFDISHVRIRPIQDGELNIHHCWRKAKVVEIQCSSRLDIKFDELGLGYDLEWHVDVLKVHFSGESQSSLKISGPVDHSLRNLSEVWLKGYTEAHKKCMQQEIKKLPWPTNVARPVLKLVGPRSS